MSIGAICYGLVLLAPISLAITLIAHLTAFLLLSPSRKRRIGPTPPITVLKPLKGAEDGLYDNLASLARQDYPDYEILIGADDPLDPALEVARQVQADHPEARIHLCAGSRHLGLNPKVNLLAALSDRAEHDHLLISDSNVRVEPGYLRDTAAELADPAVGLVTNVLVGEDADRLGGVLECLHLNSFVASAASFARVVGRRVCVIGKSMLFRKRDLDRLGGFWAVRNVLAEDYVIGRSFELAGYKVALSP
jgi:ceramide glucosyltransferase